MTVVDQATKRIIIFRALVITVKGTKLNLEVRNCVHRSTMAYSKHQIWFTKQHSVDCWLCWGRKLSSHTNRIDNRHCRPPLWCLALHEMLSIISGGNFCLWVWLAGLHIQHHLHQREVTLGSKGQSEEISQLYIRDAARNLIWLHHQIFLVRSVGLNSCQL